MSKLVNKNLFYNLFNEKLFLVGIYLSILKTNQIYSYEKVKNDCYDTVFSFYYNNWKPREKCRLY